VPRISFRDFQRAPQDLDDKAHQNRTEANRQRHHQEQRDDLQPTICLRVSEPGAVA